MKGAKRLIQGDIQGGKISCYLTTIGTSHARLRPLVDASTVDQLQSTSAVNSGPMRQSLLTTIKLVEPRSGLVCVCGDAATYSTCQRVWIESDSSSILQGSDCLEESEPLSTLQYRELYYFICNSWFTCRTEDKSFSRVIISGFKWI